MTAQVAADGAKDRARRRQEAMRLVCPQCRAMVLRKIDDEAAAAAKDGKR